MVSISSGFRALLDFFKGSNVYSGNSYLLGQKGPIWLDVNKPYEMYNSIPQLKAIVDKRAMMYSAGMLRIRNKKTGELVEDKEFSKLINNPNPTQSMNEWLVQLKQQKLIYGNQFIYKNKTSALSKYPVALWNISPRYVQPVLTGKVFDQIEIDKIIAEYQFQSCDDLKKYPTKDIIWSKYADLDNPLIGTSPINSLQFPLSNTKLAYEYRNVIMSELGGIGILSSGGTKDIGGSIPMTPTQKKELQESLKRKYGVQRGQQRIHLTEANMTFTPMTYPTKEMLLFEEVDANLLTIADHYGVNRNLFLNSTYENLKHGMVMTYQDTIIPDADQDTQLWTKELGVADGFEIFMDYSHLSILREDSTDNVNNFKSMSESVVQLVTNGLLTAAEGKKVIDSLLLDLKP